MRFPTHLRKATGIAGGALGLLGLMMTPASACLTADAGGATASRTMLSPSLPASGLFEPAAWSVAPHTRPALKTAALTSTTAPADKVELVLDRISTRLAADRAQWAGVTSLRTTQLRAAKHDLGAAKLARGVLAALDRSNAGTAAQQERISALKSSATTLVVQLRGLLAAYADRPALRTVRFGDRDGTFHRCDGDRDGASWSWSRHRDGYRR